jgi:ribosomal protein S18 acetylase RimI-like enzyme
MEITGASILDLRELSKLTRACFPKHGWILSEGLGLLLSPAIVRLKAAEEGRMAGFIAGRKPRADGVAWILMVGVLPEFRRRGLARQLLWACEGRLVAPRIRLFVGASNEAAIRLYAEEGYARVGLRAGSHRGAEPAVIMERTRAS